MNTLSFSLLLFLFTQETRSYVGGDRGQSPSLRPPPQREALQTLFSDKLKLFTAPLTGKDQEVKTHRSFALTEAITNAMTLDRYTTRGKILRIVIKCVCLLVLILTYDAGRDDVRF